MSSNITCQLLRINRTLLSAVMKQNHNINFQKYNITVDNAMDHHYIISNIEDLSKIIAYPETTNLSKLDMIHKENHT